MAGLKKTKKQAKRKSINRRTKRNVKTIKKYTRKNKMVGGSPYASSVRVSMHDIPEWQLGVNPYTSLERRNKQPTITTRKTMYNDGPTFKGQEPLLGKTRRKFRNVPTKINTEKINTEKRKTKVLEEEMGLPVNMEVEQEMVEVPFVGPDYTVSNIPVGMEEQLVTENEQSINESLINLQEMYGYNDDYESSIAIDDFKVLNNKLSYDIYDDVVDLVVNNPLLFAVNYERLIHKNDKYQGAGIVDTSQLYYIEYRNTLMEVLSEFYESDYNVYDNTEELFFTDDDDDLYYLCVSHLCYIARKMVKDKLLELYQSYVSSGFRNDVPLLLMDNLDTNNNYVMNTTEFRALYGGNPIANDYANAVERDNDAYQSELNADPFTHFHGGCFINPYKINIHKYTDLDKFNDTLNQEVSSGFPSFQVPEFETLYNEIYDINHQLNLDTVCLHIEKELERIKIMGIVNTFTTKLHINCEHALSVVNTYRNYILNLRGPIDRYADINEGLYLDWTLQLALSVTKYEDINYYTTPDFIKDMDSVLSSVFYYESPDNIIDMSNYLEDIHIGWQNYISSCMYNLNFGEEPEVHTEDVETHDFVPGQQGGIKFNLNGGMLPKNKIDALVFGHMIYDNAHDFEFNVYADNRCDKICSSSLVSASESVELYKDVTDRKIEGEEKTIKQELMNIVKNLFTDRVVYKSFDITGDTIKQTTTLADIKTYINKNILKLPDNVDNMQQFIEQNKSLYFYYDQGHLFIQIMFQNKLPGMTAETKVKLMESYQQNTLLKSWDSSTGGTIIGNDYLRTQIKTSVTFSTLENLKLLTIAFNIHSFMSMTHYFEQYAYSIKSIFKPADNAVVPILQCRLMSPGKITFDEYIQFMRIDDCIEIRKSIISIQEQTKDKPLKDLINALVDHSKHIGTISFNVVANNVAPKTYETMIYRTSAKFSAAAIMKGLNLGAVRSENPTEDSLKTVGNFFEIPTIKDYLIPNKKPAYGFMIKHSGDQCQGYQTQEVNRHIYGRIIDGLTQNTSPNTNHVLSTDDILAFCNAVYNGSNAFLIKHTNTAITLIHTTSEFGVTDELIARIKETYKNLLEFKDNVLKTEINDNAEFVKAYATELDIFKNIIDAIIVGGYSKDELKKNNIKKKQLLEIIGKVENYNKYINVMSNFKLIADKAPTTYAKVLVPDPVSPVIAQKEVVIRTWPTDPNVLKTATLEIEPKYLTTDVVNDVFNNEPIVGYRNVGELNDVLAEKINDNPENPTSKLDRILLSFTDIINNIKNINDFVKGIVVNSVGKPRTWFKKIIGHLTTLEKYFNTIQDKLQIISKHIEATLLLNNTNRIKNFNIVNNDLNNTFKILYSALNEPQNNESKSNSLKVTYTQKSNRYDISLNPTLLYYLIKNSKIILWFGNYPKFVHDFNTISELVESIKTKYNQNDIYIKKLLS